MFSELRDIMDIYEVEQNEIVEAEKIMGITFPDDLRKFYQEMGYGFVKNEIRAINRLIDPLGCSDIRMREDIYEYDPDLEMYEIYEENSLIFFEVNEGVYVSIGLNDGKIYFTDKVIAESLFEFLQKSVDPDYWTGN